MVLKFIVDNSVEDIVVVLLDSYVFGDCVIYVCVVENVCVIFIWDGYFMFVDLEILLKVLCEFNMDVVKVDIDLFWIYINVFVECVNVVVLVV